jgi:hypothetical protein
MAAEPQNLIVREMERQSLSTHQSGTAASLTFAKVLLSH